MNMTVAMIKCVVAMLCVHLLIMWLAPLVEGKQDVTLGLAEMRNGSHCSGWTVYNSNTNQCVCSSSLLDIIICHMDNHALSGCVLEKVFLHVLL